jgi:hypothetical protein
MQALNSMREIEFDDVHYYSLLEYLAKRKPLVI